MMSFIGISVRQHFGGNIDSVCMAVVIKVVKHVGQYECVQLRLYIFLVGISSRQEAHSNSLIQLISDTSIVVGGEPLL
jgi:hypothetical protein